MCWISPAFVHPCLTKKSSVLLKETETSQKIADMGQRIRQLEDALTIFQSSVSEQKHPLLDDDKLLSIKFDIASSTAEKDTSESPASIVDTMGILSVREGEIKYYGANAGSEPLLGGFLHLNNVALVLIEAGR